MCQTAHVRALRENSSSIFFLIVTEILIDIWTDSSVLGGDGGGGEGVAVVVVVGEGGMFLDPTPKS